MIGVGILSASKKFFQLFRLKYELSNKSDRKAASRDEWSILCVLGNCVFSQTEDGSSKDVTIEKTHRHVRRIYSRLTANWAHQRNWVFFLKKFLFLDTSKSYCKSGNRNRKGTVLAHDKRTTSINVGEYFWQPQI